MSARHLHLNLNALSDGFHPGGWRRPDADPRALFDVGYYQRLGQVAERGTFDAIFFADNPRATPESAYRPPFSPFDPLQLLTAIAAVTERIGLVATVSTSFSDPYSVARRIGTLDHLSRGRAAWNVVTTADTGTAANFGATALPEREARYARAEEFVDVVRGLWDGWLPDAVVADKAGGEYVSPSRVRPLGHSGDYFDVAGPLSFPRPPQGHPVVFQAGGSPAGRALAARQADAVFSAAVELEEARAYRDDIRRQAERQGRSPESVKVLPGLLTIVGGTEEEARRRQKELEELAGDRPGVQHLAHRLHLDPERLAGDRPVPPDVIAAVREDQRSPRGFVRTLLPLFEAGLTVREIVARTGDGNGHRAVVGAPEQVADAIATWFEAGAADGFNITPDTLPDGLEALVDHVVPILRERDLFRHEYEGTTLRDHLGLPAVEPAATPAGQVG